MSPASKSKSKSSGKSAKEQQQKASIKPSGSTNNGNGVPASAYNPVSGTFHTLDTSSIASSPPYHDNGRFRNIDDTEEHSTSPHGTVSEYDSVSNNGSCSGESEDPKEKFVSSTPRPEPIPGSDNDRREKIRLKNEKKHQRQREKRAQELHERCCGYLMSRKLEALSQQLVAMGFSSEQATLALMLNDGRVEESVNWLFEVGEEEARNKDPKLESGGTLKINISEELARISAMEVRYKCSKQEVERAVVACEGDLDKAEDSIKLQKQEPPATSPKPDDNADAKILVRPQEKLAAPVTIQQKRNERDFNYTKATATVPSTYSEPGSRNLQSPVTNQSKSLADKRWATSGSSPSISLTVAAPLQVASPAKVEVRQAVIGSEGKNNQQVREPVVVMQRPQSLNSKQIPVSSVSASPTVTAGWYAKNVPTVESLRPNGKVLPSMASIGTENQHSEQFYHQVPYKEIPHMYGPVDSASAGLGGSWNTIGTSPSHTAPSRPRSSWSTTGMSAPSLAVPSSLGLFASWGSAGSLGSSTQVDWNTGGLMPECDYTSIDWTLDTRLPSSKTNGLWLGLSSLLRNGSGMRMGSANGSCMSGLQDSGVVTESSSSAGLREWTSPFAEKDIFSVPRQFVTSPSP